jgi:transaldolase, mycobacterial type
MSDISHKVSPLAELHKYGQSFWLDYIRKSLITSGELNRLIHEDGLKGVTSNPTIFEKAIAGSRDYDDALRHLIRDDPQMEVGTLFEKLAIQDIQIAADVLFLVYEKSHGTDGFVSFELPPKLAHDANKSISEARRIWKEINRANVMIKVPATPEGSLIVETLTAESINVNVTLIFSLPQYEAVARAYIRGLQRCQDPGQIASVASFFISRIDTLVDKKLEKINNPQALSLRGSVALSIAKTAYQHFKDIFSGTQWEQLMQQGARPQRLLWASTSTKEPAYSDVLYVEELIGPHTVNTIPPATVNAFRDHGNVEPKLEKDLEYVKKTLEQLPGLGIDMNEIGAELQTEGLRSFAQSYDKLLSALEEKRQSILTGQEEIMTFHLGKYEDKVNARLDHWEKIGFTRRLWQRDPSLWSLDPVPEITDRLGWLFLHEKMHRQFEDFVSFAQEIHSEGMTDVVLLGMGGSSLAPEVFQNTFGNASGYPSLTVLDSTHPSAIRNMENKIDLHRTLFIVSSKSGTTLETLSLFRYFWKQMEFAGDDRGHHFIAITDPDTPLAQLAAERSFRRVFEAIPDVGGRYSALTAFGMVPAALIGMDVYEFLDRSLNMYENCAFCVRPGHSYGLVLGTAMGELALAGRDKITFLASSDVKSFPVWLEQLIAESTGKNGKGIVPIVDEPLQDPEVYSTDRFFVGFITQDDGGKIGKLMKKLNEAGHPTVRIFLKETKNLAHEIFNWEIGVASAGAVLGIHPFNQPDVQMAKDLAKKMMQGTDDISDEIIETISIDDREALSTAIDNWLTLAKPDDYVSIQAYLMPTPEMTNELQEIRQEILSGLHVATSMGYGPRFLHSIGQLHKGGPNTGLFLQLIDEIENDLEVPETDYTFGELIHASAQGDYAALKHHGRRTLRVNLKDDALRNITGLKAMIREQIKYKQIEG